MGVYWLLDAPGVLRDAGCVVVTDAGWETRSRSSGGLDAVLGIVAHHNAGGFNEPGGETYSWRTSASRPVGNFFVRRDGTWVVGAAGAANTQGRGGPFTVSKGSVPVDGGNRTMIGVEAHNRGTGETWPKAQLDSYMVGLAALCRRYDLDPMTDLYTHAGYCEPTQEGRKVDPAGPTPGRPLLGGTAGNRTWDQHALRVAVHAEYVRLTDTIPPDEGDDEMTNDERALLDKVAGQVDQIHSIMATTLWDGHPGIIVDAAAAPGTLNRLIKGIAAHLGVKDSKAAKQS